jgi:hypothetical protein
LASGCYDVYGLTLVSDFPLNLSSASGSGPVIEFRSGEPSQTRHAEEKIISGANDWCFQALQPDQALYERWGSYFEILSRPGSPLVLYANLSDCPLQSFEAYLTNFAASAALIQTGEEPLHSTVVEIEGSAIGLLGNSGAGKSTLAAALIDRGATLITDDILRLIFADGEAWAQEGPYRIKLYSDPAERYLPNAHAQRHWSFPDKRIYQPEKGRRRGPRRLKALIQLDWPSAPDIEGPTMERLQGFDLFSTILSSAMSSKLHTPERLKRLFHFCERLGGVVPVYRLCYERDFNLMDKVIHCIREVCLP